jgi:hypothetical protein
MSGEKAKGKKIGRNVNKCKRYSAEMRKTKNRRKKDKRIAAMYARLGILADKRARKMGGKYIDRANVLWKLAEQFEKRAA